MILYGLRRAYSTSLSSVIGHGAVDDTRDLLSWKMCCHGAHVIDAV
jgi:hypothetical protein